MAKKKLAAIVKIQIPAGQATPAPPVGTALGPHGINIMDFCKAYNAATESQRGMVIPAEISIFEDRSFTFVTKTPPDAVPAPPGRGDREGRGEPAHRQGGQGHERAGTPDRRDQDARPQRHRPRRRDRPGGGHRPLDGHRDHRLAPAAPISSDPRTSTDRIRGASTEPTRDPREPGPQGRAKSSARWRSPARRPSTRCGATTASRCSRPPRRSSS